ncbi:MAG: hypothetical protein BGO21_03070 [Dyadobacter sp. 50-39]|nr:MAG: hypothetical protein BGO21_03070 [Dyadobacter sp. 50-39]
MRKQRKYIRQKRPHRMSGICGECPFSDIVIVKKTHWEGLDIDWQYGHSICYTFTEIMKPI